MRATHARPRAFAGAAGAAGGRDQIGGMGLVRAKLAAWFARLLRSEFWPTWVIYLPLLPYIFYLALRHGGMRTCTLANPGIHLGGLIGESKWEILRLLSPESIVSTAIIDPAPPADRVAMIEGIVRDRGWSWPVILKPDMGERGRGVSLAGSVDEVRRYVQQHRAAVLAQAYHEGPHEAGVFYVRMPDESTGRIFSITDKRFPSIAGDGRSSIRTLIWRDRRYRLQARILLGQLADDPDRVPVEGERIELGFMGNHCRGSMFLDGSDLITPQLTAAIDAIAVRTPGFYFGRFDVRYSSREAFKAGREFRIVELNGLLSESTNIYDPGMGFLRGQAILREQWRWAFRIGRVVRRRGVLPAPLSEAVAAWRRHARQRAR